jgi:hypothetical protein
VAEDDYHFLTRTGDCVERGSDERFLALRSLHDMKLFVATHTAAAAGGEEDADGFVFTHKIKRPAMRCIAAMVDITSVRVW